MKNIKRMLLIIGVIIVGIGLTSCNDEIENNEKEQTLYESTMQKLKITLNWAVKDQYGRTWRISG